MTSASERPGLAEPDLPARVSTLELFFDLVFVFTITQLTTMLAQHISFAVAGHVLLVFGVLWWMYGAYALWAAALALQALSPLVVHPRGLFQIAPAHFVERHGSLVIVAFGESVAVIGIGAAGQRVTAAVALSAALGLALTASLWWAFFGTGDDQRAEEAITAAAPEVRPQLALNAYFYAYIPMLLGVVAASAGLKHAIGHLAAALPAGPAISLAGGVMLFLAGDTLFRRALRIGPLRYRSGAAALALVAWPVAVAASAAAGIVLLTVVVAGTLAVERRITRDTVDA